MSAGFPWHRNRTRRYRRRKRVPLPWDLRTLVWQYHPTVFTLVVALILAYFLIGTLEDRLRPVLLTAAQVQTRNTVTVIIEEAILAELDRQALGYSDLVRVERAEDGLVTAITTDMASLNRLRSTLVEALLDCVSEIDEEAIAIPLGSLIDSEIVWGRGPTIKVKSFTVGTVCAEFESEFSTAGVNQTLHKIWLELTLPTTILLPGTQLEVLVDTRLCVAETVIVGKVPSYVQKAYG